MSTQKPIDLDMYTFRLRETNFSVIVEAMFSDKRSLEKKDTDELEEFFKDLGKWEAFIKTGKGMHTYAREWLEDLGFGAKKEDHEEYQICFDADKKDDRVVNATIRLKPEECLLRSKGRARQMKLSVNKVEEMIRNVPKWKRYASMRDYYFARI